MQLLIRRFANPRARRVRFADERGEPLSDSDASGSSAICSSAPSMGASCGFEPGQRLAEQPQRFEQPHDIAADARGRTEVDDLNRDAAADAIEPSDALFHDRRLPRQVEQHQPAAELEVAAFAAALGRDQQAGAVDLAEARDFGVAPCRRQLLVKHAGGELRALARAPRAPSPASRDARRRPASSPSPRATSAPASRSHSMRGSARVHRLGLRPQRVRLGQARRERRSRRERAPDAVDLVARAPLRWRRRSVARRSRPRPAVALSRSSSRSTGMPTRGGNPPMSARRVELVQGGSGVPVARRASKLTSSGNSCGRSSCSKRKNPCASSSSGVALSSST